MAMRWLIACCWLGWFGGAVWGEDSLRVMSFNIRYGSADDGADHWDARRDTVVATIADFAPDLLGTQETLQFQADYLRNKLDGYAYFGRSRMKTPNEHCGIFYKTQRFAWLAGGHFWLSETPEVPESKSWDSSLPRMASWVLLSDNQRESAPAILFVNTHFDHRGAEARLKSAQLLRQRLERLQAAAAEPLTILTGDFNTSDDSPPYQALVQDDPQLIDPYRVLHPQRTPEEGTFNGFADRKTGPKIDWILADPRLKSQAADIERRTFSGRNASDHYAITAVLEFPR